MLASQISSEVNHALTTEARSKVDLMPGTALSISLPPWGKADLVAGTFHHLAHHCADVAACFEAMAALPVIRARLEVVAKRTLTDIDIARLSVLAFLHDAGKLHPGFQAKGWPAGAWSKSLHGHVREGAAIFDEHALRPIAEHLGLGALVNWGVDYDLLMASLAHHGRPFNMGDRIAKNDWRTDPNTAYSPEQAAAEIGQNLPKWFPLAFEASATPLPEEPGFQHLLCGLISLADWLGSDRRFFEFSGALDEDYISQARTKAALAVQRIGLDTRLLRSMMQQPVSFEVITGYVEARAHQQTLADFDPDERLVILEAETGSGKTEAALWRFANLFARGLVDGLYFALPTRAAAQQIHRRVQGVAMRVFGEQAPEVVLAVPGYLKAGHAEGHRLPDWTVRWDDDANASESKLTARWAAEHAKRYLAAPIAVGTVDQVMLAALQVKHAHLRSAALSRTLLVIDEVHASDRYMTEVQRHLLRIHCGRGGFALLMSATLGSTARERWLEMKRPSTFAEAAAVEYPAIWGASRNSPLPIQASRPAEPPKAVEMHLSATMAADQVAESAIREARGGARVLVIRNTVTAAIDTFDAISARGESGLMLSVNGIPTVHHSRFAPEDRVALDRAAEAALDPAQRTPQGVIVIGTQTLEQSLDIDADILLTDLCPVDVLLQRIGRLHRRRLAARPTGYETPRCLVFSPSGGLAPLLKPAFDNGLGAWLENGVPQGIYRDLSGLELTRRLIESQPVWRIPEMNRLLVESATHHERIEALHHELGQDWQNYWNSVNGTDVANAMAAYRIGVRTDVRFNDPAVLFASDEERIRTRLGLEGATVRFAAPEPGPFGSPVGQITLPAHWSRGIQSDEPVEAQLADQAVRFQIDGVTFDYDHRGLKRMRT
jgi:CRISPR-associated endonuclease/helicase Cas3